MNVKPVGWFRDFLELQMNGLTGHIERAGYPFDTVEWGQADFIADNGNPTWWVYEQTAYWLDGLCRCSILLDDTVGIQRASKIIYNVIRNADQDGYLGPTFLKNTDGRNRWPHVVFFRACIALYEYNKDPAIVAALERHYLRYRVDYSRSRDVLNVEIMLWLYGQTGNKALLTLAEETYARYNRNCTDDLCDKVALSDKKPRAHGVSYNEYSKLGAILYMHTGKTEYLAASERAFRKIDRYFMLPGGCNCSNEFMIGNDYMNSSETCDVSDYTWALSYLLKATKNPAYADKIEKCIFNAGIGAVLEDFKGLQYFSCANQVVADTSSNHNVFFKGSEWMSYRPNPGTECCPGNVNRFMPNYVLNSWHCEDDKIYALLYCASEYTCKVHGKTVKITETTSYPMEDRIRFTVTTETPFTFCFRIPSWATGYTVLIDGEAANVLATDPYVEQAIERNCTLELQFSGRIVAHRKGGKVFFTKGCLTYSFGMKGTRTIEKEDEDGFNAYSIYPDTEWRYAIVSGDYTYRGCNDFSRWDMNCPLPYIEVQAKKINNLDFERKRVIRRCVNLYEKKYATLKKECVFTPRLPGNKALSLADEVTPIRLYPYGACKLRLTVFNDTI